MPAPSGRGIAKQSLLRSDSSASQNGRALFYHPKYKLFLVVYVDDFKMSGPSESLSIGWDLIGRVITMEAPGTLKRYLGCEHEFAAADVQGFFDPCIAWTVDHPPSKEMPDILDESKPEFDENPINPEVGQLFGQPSPCPTDVIAEQRRGSGCSTHENFILC